MTKLKSMIKKSLFILYFYPLLYFFINRTSYFRFILLENRVKVEKSRKVPTEVPTYLTEDLKLQLQKFLILYSY